MRPGHGRSPASCGFPLTVDDPEPQGTISGSCLTSFDSSPPLFVTVTDVVIDESLHAGVDKIFDFEAEGAALVAEGRIGEASPWRFRRWRFNQR